MLFLFFVALCLCSVEPPLPRVPDAAPVPVDFNAQRVRSNAESDSVQTRQRGDDASKEVSELKASFVKGALRDEREKAAKKLSELLSSPSKAVKALAAVVDLEVKFSTYLKFAQLVDEVTEVGKSAQKFLAGANVPFEAKPLATLCDTLTSVLAKEICNVFAEFLPFYQKSCKVENQAAMIGSNRGSGDVGGQGRVRSGAISDEPKKSFVGPRGYTVNCEGKRHTILDKDGVIFLRPEEGDDPRTVGTIVATMRLLLSSPGRDGFAESLGKSVLTDKKAGESLTQMSASATGFVASMLKSLFSDIKDQPWAKDRIATYPIP